MQAQAPPVFGAELGSEARQALWRKKGRGPLSTLESLFQGPGGAQNRWGDSQPTKYHKNTCKRQTALSLMQKHMRGHPLDLRRRQAAWAAQGRANARPGQTMLSQCQPASSLGRVQHVVAGQGCGTQCTGKGRGSKVGQGGRPGPGHAGLSSLC